MGLQFDLAQDEFPIFVAETDEQLQALDEGLIRLEREDENMELLQTLFRAAHTLKGTAGMIGHKRMVTLTHSMETAFDGLRKNTTHVSTALIDLCLEAVDGLRLLRGEVITGTMCDVPVDDFSERFVDLASRNAVGQEAADEQPLKEEPARLDLPASAVSAESLPVYYVQAEISPNSIASAARAFQIIMLLQSVGTILEMDPSQAEVETAKPVRKLNAWVQTSSSSIDIRKGLEAISELDHFVVKTKSEKESEAAPKQEAAPKKPREEETPKPAEKPQAGQAAAVDSKSQVEKTIRTSVERLDNLMNLVGELITDRNRLYQIRSVLDVSIRSSDQMEVLTDTITHIGRITDQLQMEVMGIRMLPVSNVFNKFPRMVRDLASKIDKKVNLEIEGENTELDRSVIEVITDPLIHLVRNSVDHGIEKAEDRKEAGKPEYATVLLTARHEQGRIILTVEDDGKGIDGERVKNAAVQKGMISESEAALLNDEESINLIFSSGISTTKVVNDVSGRGVGLDIVRTNIQRLNGSVTVETWKGRGTRFQISLPLTLAIVPTLLVKVGNNTLAIPLVTVLETLRVAVKDIQTVNSRPIIRLRDKVLPLMDMAEAFEFDDVSEEKDFKHVVVVGLGKQIMGLAVDRLLGQEEVVVKSLGSLVGDIIGIASAAILGDGQVILIVDVQDLFQMANQARIAGR
ncbi:MAG: chemotaxis protein CheW [Anaerolineaceae bacterium]